MISVIVPVYNVEPYLRKCLDSILAQTYRDLEILVIDDGSTDGSGSICDEYAEKDERIRLFHTENHGLSAARNLGLDIAKGDWIGFVDSDDWIELDMYEVLLSKAEESSADVAECGVFWEYTNKTIEHRSKQVILSGTEAVCLLAKGELTNFVWNRLWKTCCFDHVRFPKDRIYEDVAVTYQLIGASNCVCIFPASKYHYLQRIDSLSRIHNMKNLTDYWLSHSERYQALKKQVDEKTRLALLLPCSQAAIRTWAYYYDCPAMERAIYSSVVWQMHGFVRQYIPLFGNRGWKIKVRIGSFFPHYRAAWSFKLAWIMNRVFRQLSISSRNKTAII